MKKIINGITYDTEKALNICSKQFENIYIQLYITEEDHYFIMFRDKYESYQKIIPIQDDEAQYILKICQKDNLYEEKVQKKIYLKQDTTIQLEKLKNYFRDSNSSIIEQLIVEAFEQYASQDDN